MLSASKHACGAPFDGHRVLRRLKPGMLLPQLAVRPIGLDLVAGLPPIAGRESPAATATIQDSRGVAMPMPRARQSSAARQCSKRSVGAYVATLKPMTRPLLRDET